MEGRKIDARKLIQTDPRGFFGTYDFVRDICPR